MCVSPLFHREILTPNNLRYADDTTLMAESEEELKILLIIKKWAKELNRHFSKEDIQMAKKHEKMLNITHYQINANQNHNEVPLHASQDGCYPKVYKQ